MNTSLKMHAYVMLSMCAFLSATVSLVTSWHILAADPRLDNYAAVLGYTVSIFGLAGAMCGLIGALNYKASGIVMSAIIDCVTLALILPTVGLHVLLLICRDQQGRGLLDEKSLYHTAQKPWLYGTQICLLGLLQLTKAITAMLGYNLFKVIDTHKRLSRKFDTIVTTAQSRRMLYTRKNYEDLILVRNV